MGRRRCPGVGTPPLEGCFIVSSYAVLHDTISFQYSLLRHHRTSRKCGSDELHSSLYRLDTECKLYQKANTISHVQSDADIALLLALKIHSDLTTLSVSAGRTNHIMCSQAHSENRKFSPCGFKPIRHNICILFLFLYFVHHSCAQFSKR